MSKAREKSKLRQNRILEFMREEVRSKGYAPTVREICQALDIKSTSTVHSDIKTLVAEGYLRKDPAKPRALVVIDAEKEEKTAEADSVNNVVPIDDNIVEVPVVGHIAAGQPILAVENIEDNFPVPSRFVRGTCYMLKVRGESMINAGIFDGDLILVQQQETASNGEIVVAMIDGFESEATVKTFYKEDGHVRLQPENDTMSPIIVQDVKILGKVKGVFRYYS